MQEKQRAEIDRAQEQIDLESQKRQSEMRLAEAELEHAAEELAIARQVATKLDLLKATLAVEQLKEKKAQAAIPVEKGHLEVYKRALELTTHDYEVKRQELSISLAAKQGAVAAAQKQLEKLRVEREDTVLTSPIDGIVTLGKYEEGDVLKIGEPAFEIDSQNGLLFEAAVPSEDIGLVSVGMPVRMKLDAFFYQKYGTVDGVVEYVSPDSVKNEDSEKKVVAYLVRIALDGTEFGHGIDRAEAKLGMTGTAEIVTGQESILFLFFQKVRQSISLD
jgi:HlyD family secretion protein